MLVRICLHHMQGEKRILAASFFFYYFFYCTPPKPAQLLPRCCLLQTTSLIKEPISSQEFVIVSVRFCYHQAWGGTDQCWQHKWPLVTHRPQSKAARVLAASASGSPAGCRRRQQGQQLHGTFA